MPLHHVIACVVDHCNLHLQQRARKSVLRLDIHVYQIICNWSNRVQILRSISSRWRFKSPRGSTVTNALKLPYTMVEKITSSELIYKIIKMGFHHSVWTPLCWGYGGARRLVTSVCLIICVVNRWGGEDVGNSTQAPLNVPTGPHDLDANERGSHVPNDGNTQPTTSAQTGSKGSNKNNKTPRARNNPDTTSDFQCNKKQKQTPSHQQCHSQSSVSSSTHVDFKCVTININGFSEEKWKYILSLPVIQSVSVIILTENLLSATFCKKKRIDSGWNIQAVAGVLKRRSKQHQHRGGVAILYRNASNLKIDQHSITDGSNGSSH